jgi:hypothetical protein
MFTSGTVNLLEGGGAITIASSAGGQSLKFSVPAQTNLAGVGNVSLASAGSTISISGMGVASLGVVGSETTYTSGDVIFSGQSNITLGTSINGGSQYILISAPNPGAGGGLGGIEISNATQSSTITAGSVLFQTGNGITFGLNGSTMTASHNALTSQSTGVAGLDVNAIATTFTSGYINFTGSNNITVTTGAQQIIISGPATHAIQTGISSIGATDTTYTSGGVSFYGSGLVSLSSTSGQGIVISVVGVKSLNGYTNQLSISAGSLIAVSNNNSTIIIHNSLSSTGTVFDVGSAGSYGTMVDKFAMADHVHRGIGMIYASGANGANSFYDGMTIATGNTNITLSTGVSAMSIYGPTGGGGVAISNSQSLYSSGTLNLLEGGGAITIAAGAQSLKFSVPATSSLVQSGNVSISTNGSTIVISGIGTTLSLYEPFPLMIASATTTAGLWTLNLLPFTLYNPISFSQINVIGSASVANTSASNTYTVSIGGTSSHAFSAGFSITNANMIDLFLFSQPTDGYSTDLRTFTSTRVSFNTYLSATYSVSAIGGAASTGSISMWHTMSQMISYPAMTSSTLTSINALSTFTNWGVGYTSFGTNANTSNSTTFNTTATSSISVASTGGATTAWSSWKMIPLPFATSLSVGQYWLGMVRQSSTASASNTGNTNVGANNTYTTNISGASAMTMTARLSLVGNTVSIASSLGWLGAASANSMAPVPGLGSFSATWASNTTYMNNNAQLVGEIAFSQLRTDVSFFRTWLQFAVNRF